MPVIRRTVYVKLPASMVRSIDALVRSNSTPYASKAQYLGALVRADLDARKAARQLVQSPDPGRADGATTTIK